MKFAAMTDRNANLKRVTAILISTSILLVSREIGAARKAKTRKEKGKKKYYHILPLLTQ